MVGEALGEEGLDADSERAGQFFNFVGADADGGIEAVFGGKLVGEDIGLGDGDVTGRLVGVVAAYVEVERSIRGIMGERHGPLTRAMGCIIELYDAIERGGQVQISEDLYAFPSELFVALGFNVKTLSHQGCDSVENYIFGDIHALLPQLDTLRAFSPTNSDHNDFRQSSSIVCNCPTVSRVSSPCARGGSSCP